MFLQTMVASRCLLCFSTHCVCDPIGRRSAKYPRKEKTCTLRHSSGSVKKTEGTCTKRRHSRLRSKLYMSKEGPKLSNDKFLRVPVWRKLRHLHNFFLDQRGPKHLEDFTARRPQLLLKKQISVPIHNTVRLIVPRGLHVITPLRNLLYAVTCYILRVPSTFDVVIV